MLLNYDIFCSFGFRCFSKTPAVGKESLHIHHHCELIRIHRLGKVTPKHGATLPIHILKKIEIWKVFKTQINCGSLVTVSACILKTITHLYYNCFWNYLSSDLKRGQSISVHLTVTRFGVAQRV